ncbi:MAG: glycosyltransferase family 4 protein [Candidatus Reddybacter sp.]
MSLPHIGIVSPEFPPDIGGVENYAYGYVKALATMGYPVTVFTKAHINGEVSIPGVKIRPELKLRRALDRRLIDNSNIDAWHAMNATYAWITEESDKPIVVSVHGNDFLGPYCPVLAPAIYRFGPLWRWEVTLRRFEKRFENQWKKLTEARLQRWLPKADRILTNSLYTEKVLMEKIPDCKGKTMPALVGIDPFFLQTDINSSAHQGPTRLLSITRLAEPRKNIHRVLNALAKLKADYEFHYTVIGDGHAKSELEELSKKLGLSDRVDFTGSLPRQELRQRLTEADLFILTSSVLPTSHEGFGLVYLEAAACGVPSLAVEQAGAAEAVLPGVSGFFIPTADTTVISEALRGFLSGKQSFDRGLCRQFAERFSWSNVVEKAIPIYSQARM